VEDSDKKDDVNTLIMLGKLWLSGMTGSGRRLPTVHIPSTLAEHYHLTKPCKVTFRGMPKQGGILIKFYGELD